MADLSDTQEPPAAPSQDPEISTPPLHKRKWIVPTVAGVIAVLIGLGAFALTNGGTPANGTLRGKVELINPPGKAPNLEGGTVMFSHVNTFKTKKTVTFGPSGSFSVSLPPGYWSADAEATYDHGAADVGSGCSARVASGKTSTVTIELNVTNVAYSLCSF
jgi:hypothetical protein